MFLIKLVRLKEKELLEMLEKVARKPTILMAMRPDKRFLPNQNSEEADLQLYWHSA